ncbi:LPS-assembly protein LptD [Rhizobium sp. L1K21]|uniref:LPS-assembly protein LptD n=1 Tax=Rhizobium sp. L1K21 TaxID=2954933 RepID=UPI0020927E47|nr:LPS-assembly protein LptD [Rhizobium sp. L1K21]MCO6186517.1 LPS-assembly protein LptD [Rhizobium sp. L1K21]
MQKLTLSCAAIALLAQFAPAAPAYAQEAKDDSKLYLTSNTLVYDQDNDRILVNGGVQIFYDGYKLVAERVVYDQKNGRMTAKGKVELIEPGGNRIYADDLDITDDFSAGFLNALRVETTDDTHLAAESAQRINSTVMVLNNGVYTACKPCADNPDKAPFWQVKARKITQNDETHMLELEGARFELLGVPLAYVPYLQFPDHTVKRKSGILTPTAVYSNQLGYGVSVPYYYVLSPSSDATFTPTYYSNAGLLMDVEYRKRFRNGKMMVRVGGIHQTKPSIFGAGTSDAAVTNRALVHTTGEFKINPRWAFGWDLMAQTDNNFAYTYKFSNLANSTIVNQIYLTGYGERNSFDLRGYYFDVQDGDKQNKAEKQQAIVHPVLDYKYFAPEPVAGGELSATVNVTSLTRGRSHAKIVPGSDRFHGLSGNSTRLTSELEWHRTVTTDGGLQLTPLLAARADGHFLNVTDPNSLGGGLNYGGNFYSGTTAARTMVTAGLEAKYPILIATAGTSHVIEPIGQIFVRPNEQLAGGLPNEDAQSFVFDATNLFERDKFSGFDRIEGGTRANVGFRYTGSLGNGFGLHGIFGQSYHLAGLNSFATNDLVNAGAESGLQTRVSDFVGLIGASMPQGFTASASGRFDKSTFALRRLDTQAGVSNRFGSLNVIYSQIAPRPSYGTSIQNRELNTSASVNVAQNWKVYGGLTWDIDDASLRNQSLGLSYQDECTIFSLNFSRGDDLSTTNWAVTARLSFRTIGDLQTTGAIAAQ